MLAGVPPTYLSVGQSALRENFVLNRVLATADVRARLLGRWNNSPCSTFATPIRTALSSSTISP